jgi:hypothetical protein
LWLRGSERMALNILRICHKGRRRITNVKVICHVQRRSAAFQEYDIQTEGRAMELSYFPITPFFLRKKSGPNR